MVGRVTSRAYDVSGDFQLTPMFGKGDRVEYEYADSAGAMHQGTVSGDGVVSDASKPAGERRYR